MRIRLIIIFMIIFLSMSYIYAQEEWYVIYDNAIKDIEKGKYEKAIKQLEELILEKPYPAFNEPTYADYRINYIPYFYLGKAYLFSGKYDKALINFQKEDKFEVIKKANEYVDFIKLKVITHEFINYVNKLFEFSWIDQDINIARLISLLKHKKYLEAWNILSKIIGKPLKADDRIITLKEEELRRVYEESDSLKQFTKQFDLGLTYYLNRDYRSAHEIFSNLKEKEPDNYHIDQWIAKVKSEYSRFGKKLPEKQDSVQTPKITDQTKYPRLIILVPDSAKTKTSSNNILIAGIASDIRGIICIKVVLNGEPYHKDSAPFVLRPSSNEDSTNFPFNFEVPLILGKYNEITLTAYSNDNLAISEQLTIFREPPIYMKSSFYKNLIIFIVLIIGIIAVYKVIKQQIAYIKGFNPYIAGPPIIDENMFFGRKDILETIINCVHNNNYVLIGPRRIGKTSLQYQIKRILETKKNTKYFYIPVLVDLEGISEDKFFCSIMEDILKECNKYFKTNSKLNLEFFNNNSYDNIKFNRDLKNIIMQISNSRTDKELRLILLIDEVDALNSYSDTTKQLLRSMFVKAFPENLRTVMSGTFIRKTLESEESPWFNILLFTDVPPLKREECEALIKNPVKGIFNYDDSAIEKIIKHGRCMPFLTQLFCSYAIEKIVKEKRRKVQVDDVKKVRKKVIKYARMYVAEN